MSENEFPEGWSEEKVRRIIAHDEKQREGPSADDGAGFRPSETLMTVPHDLVPIVRELIAKHRG